MGNLQSHVWIEVLDFPQPFDVPIHDWFVDDVESGVVRTFNAYPIGLHLETDGADVPDRQIAVEANILTKGTLSQQNDVQKGILVHQLHVIVSNVLSPGNDPTPYIVYFTEVQPAMS